MISFFNVSLSFVNGLPPLFVVLCKSLPDVYADVCSHYVSFDYIFVSQPLYTMKTGVIIASRNDFRSMVGSGSISPDVGLLGDDMIMFLTSAIVNSSNDASCEQS